MINLATIPAKRLAMLDTAMLYSGSHGGTGGPDCKHCARELLHEIVTGEHRDATPAGCSRMMNILPDLNDGPWRDDAHRTQVMRPYLRKMLLLDPAKDEQRTYTIILARARDLARDLDLARARDLDLARARADSWERSVTALLDVICSI